MWASVSMRRAALCAASVSSWGGTVQNARVLHVACRKGRVSDPCAILTVRCSARAARRAPHRTAPGAAPPLSARAAGRAAYRRARSVPRRARGGAAARRPGAPSAHDKFYKAQDTASIQRMLNQKHLRFINCSEDGDYAQGWYLHAVEDANDMHGYVKEMPDASWRRWDNAAKAWVDIEDSVPPVIHASY